MRNSVIITLGPILGGDCLGKQTWARQSYKGQKHELNVSTYQMCVLMLFNNADRQSYKEIEQAKEIPTSDLKRCLQSLACVKVKHVLRKEPMNKDIADTDTFLFNDKFTCKFFKVKIGTVVAQRESEPENQEKYREWRKI